MRALFDERTCIDYALAGGDDYELLFTLAPEHIDSISRLSSPCAQIGTITAGHDVHCELNGQPVKVERRGYDHFVEGAQSS
jgi:thiamine-monophosphate kinase